MISMVLTADYVPAVSQIDRAMEYLMGIFKRKSLVFILSDFEDPCDKKIMQVAAKKHQMLAMRIYDEKDNEIPDVGYMLMSDSETGEQIWVNTSSARWRYTFAELQKKKVRSLEQEFTGSSASFLNISTQDDYAKLLYQYFQKR
jgi:hypothetical protein